MIYLISKVIITDKKLPYNENIFYSIIVALHFQLSIFLGLLFSAGIGFFYLVINDNRFEDENLLPTFIGSGIAAILFGIGHYLHGHHIFERKIDFKLSVLIVVNAWIIASLISAIVFILAGYPNSPTG
ncbi:MAG: hypothetical protein Q9M91_03710 [Candidatus Dojkabacteria bacterium]|nr:hypothetical protein [Candidatus Dojkabacteria bacterium]MDQ7020921.1 hypothetical protein [Candidatus Dojkabacteria bacterium]